MIQTKKLLQKPLQKTWQKVLKHEICEELVCAVLKQEKLLLKKPKGNFESTY